MSAPKQKITTKRDIEKLLVAERKSMREKQKQSAFMRKTLSIYNGMKKRAGDLGRGPLNFNVESLREWVGQILGYKCHLCGETVLTVTSFTIDHDVPISRGGGFDMTNQRVVCKSCNWQKGQLTSQEFVTLLDGIGGFAKEARTDIKRRLTIGGKWSFKP